MMLSALASAVLVVFTTATLSSLPALPEGRSSGAWSWTDPARTNSVAMAQGGSVPVDIGAAFTGEPLHYGLVWTAIELPPLPRTKQEPARRSVLRLERLRPTPGTTPTVRQTLGPELLYVEAGSLSIFDPSGEQTFGAGESLALAEGEVYGVRGEQSGTALLRLSLVSTSWAEPPAEDAEPLIEAETEVLLEGPSILFVAHMGWAPEAWNAGSARDPVAFSGPLVMAVAEGTLAVEAQSQVLFPELGANTNTFWAGAGECLAITGDTPIAPRIGDANPLSILVIGVVREQPGGATAANWVPSSNLQPDIALDAAPCAQVKQPQARGCEGGCASKRSRFVTSGSWRPRARG